ncbi:hypothetical protein DAMA08_042350 [Martiniozyma asiatica (nom. inval.)]|nr:hypothetical protein DAMA08_042350 [Martiniozyma asiatica]
MSKQNTASLKITRALKKIKSAENSSNAVNKTIFVTDQNVKYKTTDRVVTSVDPPVARRPTDEEIFKNGKPDWRFMMEHFKKEGHLTETQLIKIINGATEIMESEPNLLEVDIPAVVVGDIHGQLFDLFSMFDASGYPGDTDAQGNLKQFLFLGDYVDRGDRSIEVLVLLYAIKINYPDSIWLLRGNHETQKMTEYFTFALECEKRYSRRLYLAALTSFRALPLVAILNEQFFCVHAGISSKLKSLDQIEEIDRFVLDPPSRGLFCDLLWSDPASDYETSTTKEGASNYFRQNTDRRCSEFYSFQAVVDFLDKNDLLCVIRGHQPQDKGYRMYKANQETGFPTLITLFSAPNYCHTYRNKAATLIYDGELFNVKQFDTNPKSPYYLPEFMNAIEWSIPFAAEKIVEILTAIVNITTDEELASSLPIDAINTAMKSVSLDKESEPDIAIKNSMIIKLQSLGRMSRMLNLLRSETENVEQLKSVNGGELPKGTLIDGREELYNRLQNFSEARSIDLKNEGLPPSADELAEVETRKKEKFREALGL